MIAAGGGASGSTVTGELAAFAAWVGENNYNYFAAIRRGTPGFGPLDDEAEAFGQKVSSACGIN